MGITIKDIRIKSEFRAETVKYLLGNVFYKLDVEIDFSIHTYAIADTDRRIIIAATGFVDDTYIVDENGGGMFKDFKLFEQVRLDGFGGADGSYQIVEKIDDSTIRVASGMGGTVNSTTGKIYVQTIYNSFDFLYNLIENNAPTGFDSLIDGSSQVLNLKSASTVYQDMTAQGFNSWFLGQVQIKRNAQTATHETLGFIKQTIYVSPFFLFSQSSTLAPDYFINAACLKHVFRILAKADFTDQNLIQQTDFDIEVGNAGWFGENFNGNPTKYSVSSVTYTRLSDATVIPSIQLSVGTSEETEVKIRIINGTDSPFSLGNSKAVANIINVPFDTAEYQQLSTDMGSNFSFDRAIQTEGVVSVDGDFANIGDAGSRFIKDLTITRISASELEVKFTASLGLSIYNRINAMATQKYLLAVSLQNHALAAAAADGVTLLIDYEDFYIELGTDGLVTLDQDLFIEHPYQLPVDGVSSLITFLEDEVVKYWRAKVDLSLSVFSPKLRTSRVKIQARNTITEEAFIIDDLTADLTGATVVNNLEFVDIKQNRPFQAPTGELIKQYTVKRDIPADAGNNRFYDIYHPFLIGWEYWQANADVDPAFFDVAQPNNGLNNRWDRLDNVANWQVEAVLDIVVDINGTLTTYQFKKLFKLLNYATNTTEWQPGTTPFGKTYDPAANELVNGGTRYVLGYDKTTFKAAFEWIGGGSPPLLAEVAMIFRLEAYENGGRYISTRISSVRNVGAESQWESVDTSNKVKITKVGNVYTGEAVIDNTKLQNFAKFSITARIYDYQPDEFCLLLEDGDELLLEDLSGCIEVEH